MSPKNKTLYDIHTDGYWIKKGTNAHKFAKGNDMIDVKKVYVSPTNQVPVSGVVFNKLLSDGYIYDPKSNTLTYPIETKKIIINRETSNNSIREIIQHNPHNVIMRFRDTTLNVPHGTESKMVKFIQRHQRYDETECTLQSTSGGDTPIFGAAFKGKQNCVITALKKHCETHSYNNKDVIDKLYSTYQLGVYGDDYEQISKKLSLTITVILPDKSSIVYGKTRATHASFTCYYNNNHVWSGKQDKETHIINHDLWAVEDIKDNITDVVSVIGDITCPTVIETRTCIYRLKSTIILGYDGNIVVPLDKFASHIAYYADIFIKTNDISPIERHNFNIDAIKSICQHGIMYSKKYDNDYTCYDIKKAYSTFDKCKYYNGFPSDLTYSVKIDSIEDACDILKYEGFALIRMRCLWSGELITRWVSFPYLRYYMEMRSDELTVFYMLVSLKSTDLDTACIDVNKRMWHHVLGYINRTHKVQSYLTLDSAIASTCAGYCEQACVNGNTLYKKSIKSKGINGVYYPHIAGYVQQYTEIRMEMFVLENGIDVNDIVRVWVDGIYVSGQCEITDDEWHSYAGCSQMDCVDLNYVSGVDPVYYSTKFNDVVGMCDLVKGLPGTGKSYLLKELHNQTPNSIVLVPTNELKKSFDGCTVDTIDMVLTKPFDYVRFNTFLIDEYGVIPGEKITKLNSMSSPWSRVILFGDVGQLNLIQGSCINEEEYNVLELKKIYRQIDPVFQRKLQILRDSGIFKFNKKISVKDAILKNALILSATHIDIDKINEIGIQLNPNVEIEELKKDTPIRFYKTDSSYCAGEYGTISKLSKTDMEITKDDLVDIDIKVKTFKKYHKPAHSVSFHSQQGRTVKDRIVAINKNNLFDDRMVYVGCSRVQNEDQLYELI